MSRRRLAQAEDEQCQDQKARYDRQHEQSSHLARPHPQKARCQQRTDGRAEMVHRAVKTEGPTAQGRIGRIGDQGIAGRGTDSLAHAIADAEDEQLPRRPDDADEWAKDCRHGVAEENEALAPARAIRPAAGPEFEDAGDRVGQALNDAEVKARARQDG